MKHFILCLAAALLGSASLLADKVREVHASPNGQSATRYATAADGWRYAAPVQFEALAPAQQAGWQAAMQALATLAPADAMVEQIVIEPVKDGHVTATEERDTVLVPVAWEDDFRVAVTYVREGQSRTESWEVSEPTRQFLRAMWQVFEQ